MRAGEWKTEWQRNLSGVSDVVQPAHSAEHGGQAVLNPSKRVSTRKKKGTFF